MGLECMHMAGSIVYTWKAKSLANAGAAQSLSMSFRRIFTFVSKWDRKWAKEAFPKLKTQQNFPQGHCTRSKACTNSNLNLNLTL